MREKQNENGYEKRENKEGRLRMPSVSMGSVSKTGSTEKGIKRSSVSMRRRERKKRNPKGRKRFFMKKKMRMMIPGKGGGEVSWRIGERRD